MAPLRVSTAVLALAVGLVAGCDTGKSDETVGPRQRPPVAATATASASGRTAVTTKRLMGSWAYSTSNQTVSGACPAGPPASGTMSVTPSGGGYEIAFLSGRVCDPASMCVFEGGFDGKTLSGKNGATVDDEGGKATNGLTLTVDLSAGTMSGKGTSTYQHPKGMACSWTYDITAHRIE